MECIKEYYIHNFKLKSSNDFKESVFTEGTSIYEVIRITSGIPLFLEEHLNRLFYSADISNLSISESYCDIETLIAELINKNKTKEGIIKLIIRFDKGNGSNEEDLLIYFTPHYFPSLDEQQKGVVVGICKSTRENPNAKILNTEARLIANNTIVEQKLFEVLLVNDKGCITEGSRSNVFFIKKNTIYTPPLRDVLNGITRMNIIKICKQNNIELIEKEVNYEDIKNMDCMFLTGTSLNALVVKNIGDIKFNVKNKVFKQIIKLQKDLTDKYLTTKY